MPDVREDQAVKYLAQFHGRQRGAIGVFYPIVAVVDVPGDPAVILSADDRAHAARLALYDKWEHVQQLTLTPFGATLYDTAKAAGIPIDHHASDLYLQATPAARALITAWDYRIDGWRVRTFRSQIDGRTWYDIPFAYRPFWRELLYPPKGGAKQA